MIFTSIIIIIKLFELHLLSLCAAADESDSTVLLHGKKDKLKE